MSRSAAVLAFCVYLGQTPGLRAGPPTQPATSRKFVIDFESEALDQAPSPFIFARTGKGEAGEWRVRPKPGSRDGGRVLVQESVDGTGFRFPLAILAGFQASDLDLSVRFRTTSGNVDRAAGLVWRYRDPDNYYVVRANALEGNVVAYKVEKGRRSDLDPVGTHDAYGVKAAVPHATWTTLRVVVRGDSFEAHLDGQQVFRVIDRTFAGPGQVGLWTKADSVTAFDDLTVEVLDRR